MPRRRIRSGGCSASQRPTQNVNIQARRKIRRLGTPSLKRSFISFTTIIVLALSRLALDMVRKAQTVYQSPEKVGYFIAPTP